MIKEIVEKENHQICKSQFLTGDVQIVSKPPSQVASQPEATRPTRRLDPS